MGEARGRGRRAATAALGIDQHEEPAYRDVLYVEQLIGRDTVNTMPPETIDAFRDHGVAVETLGKGLDEAEGELAELAALGISLDQATTELLDEGIRVRRAVPETPGGDRRADAAARGGVRLMRVRFPPELRQDLDLATDSWVAARSTERLWDHDAALFTGHDESRWLGWLDAPEREAARLDLYAELPRRASREGITDIVLLGMGGSSLAAEVFRLAWGERPGRSVCTCSTRRTRADPPHARRRRSPADLGSGGEQVGIDAGAESAARDLPGALRRASGEDAPGHFLAITDPGSALDRRARGVDSSPSSRAERRSAVGSRRSVRSV
ncbi:MAG: transaldolase family protein [Thermoanaerobaculia bacterium]